MKFAPMTENEIASTGLFPAGEYDFEVSAADETQSKSGNDMIKLTLQVFKSDGERRTVFDYLVATPGGAFKIRHFAESVGMIDAYNRGDMQAMDMVGRSGRCKLGIDQDKSGQFPDKNGVKDYLKPKVGFGAALRSAAPAARKPVPAGGGDLDDSIPFAACWQ